MNKIELIPIEEGVLIEQYRNYVFEETKSKLTFLIGIYSVRKGSLKFKFLKEDFFNVNGRVFQNDLKNVTRKTILNTLFNIPIKVDGIDYSQLTKNTVFKTVYQSHTFEITDLFFLYDQLEVILFSRLSSSEMTTVLKSLAGKFNSKLDRNIFELIFDYERFFHQTDTNATYFGFKLAKALKTNVCVYCNREYISTISDLRGQKIISPAFDHFLSQSEYPYLAISLFNLIPSCYSCNSQLKLAEKFTLDDYLYPHELSYESKAVFKVLWIGKEIKSKYKDDEIINIDDLSIKIEPLSSPTERKIFGDPTLSETKRKGNLKVFKTELVYDSIHKDSVHEIITQFRVHTKSDVESLKKSYKFIKDDSNVYRFYFKNYLNEEDFNKRPLARLTRDIAKQMENIYSIDIEIL